MNDSDEQIQKRRDSFAKNLQEITSHLTSKSGKKCGWFRSLNSPQIKICHGRGSLLDFTVKDIPEECQRENSDRLYLQTGIITSRLAVRRLMILIYCASLAIYPPKKAVKT